MHPDRGSAPLPRPRGPLSAQLLAALAEGAPLPCRLPDLGDPLEDEDLQLALTCCYELHYRGFVGVDDRWEWDPALLALRAELEAHVEGALADRCRPGPEIGPDAVVGAVAELVASAGGPSLSSYLADVGTAEQLREFLVHRSWYQLKEADPHTWAIPRLWGQAKAALVEIQADEYGNGEAGRVHATLFAATLRAAGLDDGYGAYLDRLPASTLATVNLVHLFGLHRRHRGALVGHLAVFEMTSVEPMGRYARALRRHGFPTVAAAFYDAHVVADAVHEVVALQHMVAGLVRQEPALAGDVLFGARAVLEVERRFAASVLDAWAQGTSSLLPAQARAVPCR
jgi:hypothetical protein